MKLSLVPKIAASCGNGQGQAMLMGCDNNTSADTTVYTVATDAFSGLWVRETGAVSWEVRARGPIGACPPRAARRVSTAPAATPAYCWLGRHLRRVRLRHPRRRRRRVAYERLHGRRSAGERAVGIRTAGTAVVASGQNKVTVSLAGVTATDMVLATVQQSGGYFVKFAKPASGSFTIYINKAPVSPATVKAAWFVISALDSG